MGHYAISLRSSSTGVFAAAFVLSHIKTINYMVKLMRTLVRGTASVWLDLYCVAVKSCVCKMNGLAFSQERSIFVVYNI